MKSSTGLLTRARYSTKNVAKEREILILKLISWILLRVKAEAMTIVPFNNTVLAFFFVPAGQVTFSLS